MISYVGQGGLVARVVNLVDEKLLDGLAVLERNKLSVGLESAELEESSRESERAAIIIKV